MERFLFSEVDINLLMASEAGEDISKFLQGLKDKTIRWAGDDEPISVPKLVLVLGSLKQSRITISDALFGQILALLMFDQINADYDLSISRVSSELT